MPRSAHARLMTPTKNVPLDLRIVRNEEGRGTPRGRLRRLVAFVGLC
jgi:hypothetical protein